MVTGENIKVMGEAYANADGPPPGDCINPRCVKCGCFRSFYREHCKRCGEAYMWVNVHVDERRRMATITVERPKIKVGGDTIGGEL